MITRIKPDEKIVGFLKKNKIINLNILGYIQNREATALVFNNDINNGIIVEGEDGGKFFVATANEDFIREFWQSLPVGKHFIFSGVPKSEAELILKLCGNPVWQNPCNVFVYLEKDIVPTELDSTVFPNAITSELVAADAKEVDEFYTYRDENSYNEILKSIEQRDTECIRIDGRLAAWALVHDDNSVGPLYVKEEFRGKNMARTVSERIAKKLLDKNHIPFAHIVVENTASHSHIQKIKGYTFSHVCVWFGMEKNLNK